MELILLYISIIFILFLPGYFLLLAIFGKNKLNGLERLVVSIGLSIAISNIILILLDKVGISITRISVVVSFLIFFFVCFGFYYFKKRKKKEENSFSFTKQQVMAIIAILVLSIFLRTVYLSNTINPTSTDLAHHMYWTKDIIVNGELPTYQKVNIIQSEAGDFEIGKPEKIDDFIIGEHLVFAAVFLISGASVISSFSSLILFVINIFSILAIFILALRMFEKFSFGKNSAIVTLLLLGPIFAFSASQSNFVSGGVIGNLMGNLFIPLSVYFVYRAIMEKNKALLALGAFSIFSLAYIHHLSAFIFLFVIACSAITLLIFSRRKFLAETKEWLKIIFSWPVISFLVLAGIFFFFIFAPSYIANQAVKTVIGEPSRITKEGLSFDQIRYVVGDPRFILGLLGFFLIIFIHKKSLYLSTILSGWFISIFLLCWRPQLFKIDMPSVRIGTYIIYPLVLLGAFFFGWLFFYLQNKSREKAYLKNNLLKMIFLLLFVFLLAGGLYNNGQSLKSSVSEYLKTFNVAEYLSTQVDENDLIVKDHNYVSSDAWMKVFFMKDYNYPFTRSFFFRYEVSATREKCTYWMITMPEGADAQKCFNDTGINFVIVDPLYDSGQFKKADAFSKVYAGDSLETYYKFK